MPPFKNCRILSGVTVDVYFVFSDGFHSTGASFLPKSCSVPTYTVCSATKADAVTLKICAKKSGGNYFNISGADVSFDALLNSVPELSKTSPLTFIGLSCVSKSVKETYPNKAEPLTSDRFCVAGKVVRSTDSANSQSIEVLLQYGYGANVVKT
jgi:hypothetical protein